MFIIYNTVLTVLLLFLWPFLLWYMYQRQGSLEGVGERLGWGWPRFGLPGLDSRRPVWFHGASVGEVQMLVPLVRAWQEDYPGSNLLVTTMTLTGRQTARQVFPEAQVTLLPLDLPFLWPLFFRHFRPAALIVAETELWPNLLNFVKRRRLPMGMVNARLSRKSFVNYKILDFFTREMFTVPHLVVVQDRVSGARFAGLGTPADKIIFSGNLKFDLLPPAAPKLNIDSQALFGRDVQMVVAGSTHPGEEEMILTAWDENNCGNLENGKPVCLVLAPRHPHCFAAVAELLRGRGIDYLRFSEIKDNLPASGFTEAAKVPTVLLLDTLGDLIHFYRLASFTIIGGTLIPGVGGHNPLEAALFARAVIHGAYVVNFKDGFKSLDEEGGGLPVGDGKELEIMLGRCLNDPDFVITAGLKAQSTIVRNRGAVARTMNALREKGIF